MLHKMPDPITLLAIFGTSAATNLASRTKPIAREERPLIDAWAPFTPTEIPQIEGRLPATYAALLPVQTAGMSQLERTFVALRQFATSPVNGDSRAADEALSFLTAIPHYLPAPKAAESESGMITLFWDTPDFYADVELRGDGHFSVFTRNRESKLDATLDDHPLEEACGNWLPTYFSLLLPKIQKAA